ncbi:MAG: hypothetical protein IPQ13_10350 [Holophagaceae bacterium]|nr:hypothetical protein [Holophagaceae bacterium]
MTLGSGSTVWLDSLRAICHETSAVDLRVFENGVDELIYSELGPRTLDLLHRSSLLLQQLHLGGPADPGRPAADEVDHHERKEHDFSFQVDALVAQEGDAVRLSDLLEMAGFHLSMKTALLNSAMKKDRWDLLDACHSSLRGARKALVALEHVACGIQGAKPLLTYQTELANSLQVRLAFAKFRESVRSILGKSTLPHEIGGAELKRMILGGSTALAVLVGRDAYPLLRARDRRQIRALQQKLLAAGIASGREQQLLGVQTLADLAAFAELITLINQREELLEHDKELARKAINSLRGLLPDEPPAREWTEAIKPLRGRDTDLDQLIRQPHGIPVRLWTALLQSLMGEELHSQV